VGATGADIRSGTVEDRGVTMAEKSDIEHIDILQMELEQKLPYWLDWSQTHPKEAEEIRKKNRDKWLAEQTSSKK
jgi:hypothetical protein